MFKSANVCSIRSAVVLAALVMQCAGFAVAADQIAAPSKGLRQAPFYRPKGQRPLQPRSKATTKDVPANVVVVNAASYLPGVSPGAVATIFGENLSSVGDIQVATTDPLPTQIADISIVVNGVYAPLFSVAYANGEDQVSFQVPYDTPTGLGAVEIQVINNGFDIADLIADSYTEDPGIFLYNGNYAIAVHYPDYNLVSPDDPASPGEVVILYATGLGPLTVNLLDGYGAPSDPIAYTQEPFQTFIAGEETTVLFSGLAPGFVGLDQLNLQLPSDLPPGDLDLQITTPYSVSGIAQISVQ